MLPPTIDLLHLEEPVNGLLAVVEGVEAGEEGVEEGVGVDVVGVEDFEDVHSWDLNFEIGEIVGILEIRIEILGSRVLILNQHINPWNEDRNLRYSPSGARSRHKREHVLVQLW